MITHDISRHAATNILHAFDYAKEVGRPLNCYVVLCCDEEGSGKTAAQICQDVRDRYRAWSLNAANRHGLKRCPPTYIQTVENPTGDNPHSNWALYITPALFEEFKKKLPQWLKKAQGGVRPMDICVQQVDPETDKTLAKYVIKGADAYYVEYFHLSEFAEDQGAVEGRRTCVSPSIGRTARREAGFIPKLHRNNWKRGYKAPAKKTPRQVFVNTGEDGALTAQKRVKKSLWGGFELRSAQEPIEPSCAPRVLSPSGLSVMSQQ